MKPETNSLAHLLARAGTLAAEAGVRAMKFYGNTTVVLKQDASPLTLADTASHEFLMAALPGLAPGIPVVSEESAPESAPAAGRFWLVDPLDGTKEFVKGTNEFTVNIALIEAGRPVLGVVHAPALGVTYFASRDTGAWFQSGGSPAVRISTRRADPARLAVVASKDHAGPLVAAMLSRLPDAELKSMGSSLKFCLVAAGQADLYLRDLPTMEWDTAAAQCVVEAAGGGVYELSGTPLAYGKPGLRNGPIMTVGDPSFSWQNRVTGAAAA